MALIFGEGMLVKHFGRRLPGGLRALGLSPTHCLQLIMQWRSLERKVKLLNGIHFISMQNGCLYIDCEGYSQIETVYTNIWNIWNITQDDTKDKYNIILCDYETDKNININYKELNTL